MSKRRLFITVLSLIAIVAVIMAVAPKQSEPGSIRTSVPSKDAHSVLAFSPQTVTLTAPESSVDVTINTYGDNVTAVQLELSFDPLAIQIDEITSGGFFESPLELIKDIDNTKGTASYALGISPAGKAQTGTGNVATIRFKSLVQGDQKTIIKLLPTSLVTAQGISTSVLKPTNAEATIVSPQ